ncbi:hypothetical protein [Spirosoma gilvum]
MKRSNLSLLLGGFLVLVLALTNPGLEVHKAKVKALLKEKVSEELRKEGNQKNSLKALGTMLEEAFALPILNTLVTRDNYLLFSVTKLTFGEESKVIGFGALGHVFITTKTDELKF